MLIALNSSKMVRVAVFAKSAATEDAEGAGAGIVGDIRFIEGIKLVHTL
jgi:ribosomal protein L1